MNIFFSNLCKKALPKSDMPGPDMLIYTWKASCDNWLDHLWHNWKILVCSKLYKKSLSFMVKIFFFFCRSSFFNTEIEGLRGVIPGVAWMLEYTKETFKALVAWSMLLDNTIQVLCVAIWNTQSVTFWLKRVVLLMITLKDVCKPQSYFFEYTFNV